MARPLFVHYGASDFSSLVVYVGGYQGEGMVRLKLWKMRPVGAHLGQLQRPLERLAQLGVRGNARRLVAQPRGGVLPRS